MILFSSCISLCPIYWSRVLSREWRSIWSSADWRCSNYIWVINNLIAYRGAPYIRDLTVVIYWAEWSANVTSMWVTRGVTIPSWNGSSLATVATIGDRCLFSSNTCVQNIRYGIKNNLMQIMERFARGSWRRPSWKPLVNRLNVTKKSLFTDKIYLIPYFI